MKTLIARILLIVFLLGIIAGVIYTLFIAPFSYCIDCESTKDYIYLGIGLIFIYGIIALFIWGILKLFKWIIDNI